jgi:hypothetical protein
MKSSGAFTRSVAMVLLFFGCCSADAQIFATNNSGLRGVYRGGMVAGDFDNDGVMDLLMSGYGVGNAYATVWRNAGNGTFVDYSELITCGGGADYGSVAAGDFFNDGRLDAILTGLGASPDCSSAAAISQLWHNLGNGSFILVTNSALAPSEYSGIAVGDFNNDGKLDVVITGVATGDPVRLFQNMGQGVFTNINLYNGDGAVFSPAFAADFDNDGYLDILYGTTLLKNLGNGTFTNLPTGLPGHATAIGDFDNDGYVDVLVGGQVYRNLGNGTFTNLGAGFPSLGHSVGDYDNDGNLDVLALGGDQSFSQVQVWRNLGNGNFTNVQTLPGGGLGSLAWGDFNNDGRLDFTVTGEDGSDQNFAPILVAQVGLNISGCPSNIPPTAPPNLFAQIMTHGGVKLSWAAATDDHTPSTGLNYNIRVGSYSGGVDIVSPEADPITGQRRVVDIGNAQERLFSLLTNLSGATYYWSVQGIDTAFAGGAFATEATFVIPPTIGSFAFGTNGQFQTSFSALAGSSYTLQASTNLSQWTNLLTLVPTTNGIAQLTDTNASVFPRRYYRLSTP